MSIKSILEHIHKRKIFTEQDLFFHAGLYHSFSHHSRFSAEKKAVCLKNINESILKTNIKNTNLLIITFGTSYIYQLKDTMEVVSNCHKLPDKFFIRRRLDVNEIVTTYTKLLKCLIEENPDLKILFSVSPIRHWKDGAHENQLSKSILLLAIEQLQELFKNVFYFPSYEIVLDELRDYRFYKEDMLHISDLAISYIWKCFQKTFFNPDTINIMNRWKKIRLALNHRPFNPSSAEYNVFIQNKINALLTLKADFPYLNIDDTLKSLKGKAD